MKNEMEVIIRDYREKKDDPYIYSTWSLYSWYSPKDPVPMGKRQFFKEIYKHIENVLKHGVVRIACLKQDPNTILGYVAVYNRKIEWACIKKDFFNQGIDRLLNHSIQEHLDERTGC